MTAMPSRGFAGGGAKKPAINPKETNYDIVFVGKFAISSFFLPTDLILF
jgi:hypothetical protein